MELSKGLKHFLASRLCSILGEGLHLLQVDFLSPSYQGTSKVFPDLLYSRSVSHDASLFVCLSPIQTLVLLAYWSPQLKYSSQQDGNHIHHTYTLA